jgi:hypothetical protein
VACPSTVFAGAWTREQGEFYLALGYAWSMATASYQPDGVVYNWRNPSGMAGGGGAGSSALPGARQIQQSMTFYAEYGLLDPLTLLVGWDLTHLDKDLGPNADPLVRQDTNLGIPEVRLGLRGRVLKAPFILSMEMIVGIPVQAPFLDPLKYNPQMQIPLGLGTYHATGNVQIGKGWTEYFPASVAKYWDLYTNIAMGFQYRDNFLSNFLFNLEIGSIFFGHLFASAKYLGEKNIGSRFVTAGFAMDRMYFGQSDQQRWAVSLGYILNKSFSAVAEYSAPTGGTQSLLFQRISINLSTGF